MNAFGGGVVNVLCLNTYLYKNNLSVPAYVFHKVLSSQGHNSCLLVARTDLIEPGVLELSCRSPFEFGISRVIRKIFFATFHGHNESYFYPEWNLDGVSAKIIMQDVPFKPDVILAFWTKFAFNQKMLYEMSRHYAVPIVSIPLDMAPLTGGCHYSFGCLGYQSKCGHCPALNSRSDNDLSRTTWEFKKRLIDESDITIFSCSSTLTNQVRSSSLLKHKQLVQSLLPVDEVTFTNREKNEARAELGLPLNKRILFFGAASLKSKRKGMSLMLDALKIIAKSNKFTDNLVVLIAGRHSKENYEIPFHYFALGYLSTEKALARAYQAADVFVCPSIEDSGPLMINQSIMCGTPVVAFNMGVAPDLVHTYQTGYLAKLGDVNDLANGIQAVIDLSGKQLDYMAEQCRKLALERYSKKVFSEGLDTLLRGATDAKSLLRYEQSAFEHS
jgi:glycosyltransferase involved in cell wall biosynthesis